MKIDKGEYKRLVQFEQATRNFFNYIPAEEFLEWETGEGQSLRHVAQKMIEALSVPSRNLTFPILEWCDIPEGYVTIENQKILVPAFRMAKYPVTYAQFQAFIDAPDGYKNDEWWQGLAQRDKTPRDQAWKIDNHPRERVNWYESMAFSRWLASKTGLPITLPTESQWQRAAQGDDGREYPWGNKFDKAKCNTSESGIGRTTPVDQYPKGASPFGVMDMAGNVWEWCLSKWADTYQHPEDNDPEGGTNVRRVLRGGSWFNLLGDARAATRNWFIADPRSGAFGCRLVVGSSSYAPGDFE